VPDEEQGDFRRDRRAPAQLACLQENAGLDRREQRRRPRGLSASSTSRATHAKLRYQVWRYLNDLLIAAHALIVEALFESTEPYDRGDKLALRRQLASLREYRLVAQSRVRGELYTPGAEGSRR